MNLAYYLVLFDRATDALWSAIGLGEPFRARTGHGTFAVEAHTLYQGELLLGDETRSMSLVLGVDGKRLHIAHELIRVRDDATAARQELMYLTVDMATRRSTRWPPDTLARLQAARDAHGALRPDWVGRRLSMPEPRPPPAPSTPAPAA